MNTAHQERLALAFMIMIALGVFSVWSSAAAQPQERVAVAWGGAGGSYSLVHFTGAFFPPAQVPEESRTLRALDVLVDGKKLVFVIKKARNLSAVETELGLLKGIFPPKITFGGDKEVLAQIMKPEIAGKPLVIRGYLYRAARRFHALSLEPAVNG
jgi:hypothetical protein